MCFNKNSAFVKKKHISYNQNQTFLESQNKIVRFQEKE